MKRPSFTALSIFALHCCNLTAENVLSTEAKQSYTAVKNNILKAADKMPEEDYSFKPTPDIRSFSEILLHVIEAQTRTCAAFQGEQKAVSVTAKASKADLIAALKQSFTVCDVAYDALTDASAAEPIKTPRGQRSKLGLLTGNTTHDVEQYSAMSVYMRLKGLIPPSSEH